MPEAKDDKKQWADDMDYPSDEDNLPELPTRHETEVDVNGHKTITTYRSDESGKKFKMVRVVKVTKKTTKMHKGVLERRKWPKFGEVKGNKPGFQGLGYTDGHTCLDASDQTLDMTPKLVVAEEANESATRAFEKMNVTSFEAWRPKQRGEGEMLDEGAGRFGAGGGDLSGLGGGGGGGGLAALAAAQEAKIGGGGSGYVPPSMRNADGTRNEALVGAMPERDDSCTVRVSNLSEDVKDQDLRELFRRFGAIQRIYLAKDRETQQSRGALPLARANQASPPHSHSSLPRRHPASRRPTPSLPPPRHAGFAFINFYQKEDAAAAIAKLDGHGYDHLILSVSWANPSAAPAAVAPDAKSAEAFPSLGGARSGPPSGLYSGVGKESQNSRFDQHVHNPQFERFMR